MIDASSLTVGVVGLGQIGGSIAGAIKSRALCRTVIGFDIKSDLLGQALDRSIIDAAATDLDELIAGSDIVVLAVHIVGILQIIDEKRLSLRAKRLVFDTGSLKTSIVRKATEAGLKNFIAAHPLAGTELRGADAWDQNLFEQANYFFVPAEGVTDGVGRLFTHLVTGIGARPIEADPEAHDRIFATTSNLPHLFAFLLAGIFDRMRNGTTDKSLFICPSYHGATRVAASDPEMVFQMLWYNRENLTDSLDYLLDTLGKVREIMECKDGTRFRELFDVIK